MPSINRLFDQPVAILDLETTGSNPLQDRITEIGLITLDPDGQCETWSSLVDPGCPIPPFITRLTGIDDEMVRGQPHFDQLAPALAERLAGRWLIAHNARFDYGFLRHAFQRAGIRYDAHTLCTVRLSRKLFPEHRHHGLDHLIQRHDLQMEARHRALGDTRAVHQFLGIARERAGAERFDLAVRQLVARPNTPPGLDDATIDSLPEATGVYLFYGDNDALLYVGKSNNIRTRVMAHFSAAKQDPKERRLSQQVRRVEWQETGGELGALLTESRLVKALNPLFNRQLRRKQEVCAWHLAAEPSTATRLVNASQFQQCPGPLIGPFSNRKAAQQALEGLADAHQLCRVALGLEKPNRATGACFQHQLRRCRGACVGLESADAHRQRLMEALGPLELQPWPFPGPIGVREHGVNGQPDILHVFHHWQHLGSAENLIEARQLAGRAPQGFDPDAYRILLRWLNGHDQRALVSLDE